MDMRERTSDRPPGRLHWAIAIVVVVLVCVNVIDIRIAHASLVLGPAGAVGVVFAAGAALPMTRGAFRDARYELGWEHAVLTAFVLIPLGTVLFEEVAFRGVLWGLLRRGHRTWVATVISSVLFGLWHVLPSLGLAADNQAIGSAVGKGTSGQAISVLGTVLFTGLAGVVFCELRRRSGSLLASAGLHWATNGLGVLAAASIWAWGSSR